MKRFSAIILLTAIGFAPLIGGAAAQNATVSVVLNGTPLSFDVPPQERAGRVFVPFRRIFEALGASVVYAPPQVNATGNGRRISLTIGSTNAIVNGQPVQLDQAAFIVGSRVMVPLRFVSENLGASVTWNQSNNTVYIRNGGGGAVPPPVGGGVSVTDRHPVGNSSLHPQIYANFTRPMNTSTVHVYLDGADITSQANIGPSGFHLTTTVQPGAHEVRVTGQTVRGANLDSSWQFNAQ